MSDAPKAAAEKAAPPTPEKPAKTTEKKAKPTPAKGGKLQKKKGPNVVLILAPVAIVAALVLAFTLPPTHAMIVKSPLRPLLAKLGLVPKTDALAAKAAPVPDPAADVKRLTAELDASKNDGVAKDAQIAQLQSQLKAAAAPPSPSPSPKATPAAVSDDVKRAATYWASMDADKAAEIAARLPDAYVTLVFSQMPPDAVADIMSALPTKTVARLTGPPREAALP